MTAAEAQAALAILAAIAALVWQPRPVRAPAPRKPRGRLLGPEDVRAVLAAPNGLRSPATQHKNEYGQRYRPERLPGRLTLQEAESGAEEAQATPNTVPTRGPFLGHPGASGGPHG